MVDGGAICCEELRLCLGLAALTFFATVYMYAIEFDLLLG